jgi:cystathionine beta-lyase
VFGVVLKPAPDAQVKAMFESLRVFSMGFSWGGYESLAVPTGTNLKRAAALFRAEGPLMRLSIGLEHPDDLIDDLAQAFAHLRG